MNTGIHLVNVIDLTILLTIAFAVLFGIWYYNYSMISRGTNTITIGGNLINTNTGVANIGSGVGNVDMRIDVFNGITNIGTGNVVVRRTTVNGVTTQRVYVY